MPCMEVFAEQDEAYRDEVLPPSVTARVCVEAGSGLGWHHWAGSQGAVIALDRFGESAPFEDAYASLGFSADAVAQAARDSVEREQG